jgi:hypothetical protein
MLIYLAGGEKYVEAGIFFKVANNERKEQKESQNQNILKFKKHILN